MKKIMKFYSILLFTIILLLTYPINASPNTHLILDSDNFSCINSNCNINTDNSYIKNTIVPKSLYVISENDMTNAEKTMIATLQGGIASKSETQIYILSPSEPDYEIWLKSFHSNPTS